MMNKTQDQFPHTGFKDVYKLNQGSGSFVAFNDKSHNYDCNTTSKSGFFAENSGMYGKSQGSARKFRLRKPQHLSKIGYPDELDTQHATTTVRLDKADLESFQENKTRKVPEEQIPVISLKNKFRRT